MFMRGQKVLRHVELWRVQMLLSLQMLNDEALELRVAVAITANRVARLDNPMLSKALEDMAAEARAVHCED